MSFRVQMDSCQQLLQCIDLGGVLPGEVGSNGHWLTQTCYLTLTICH